MNEDVAYMHGLMKWFKCDFFTWTNKPECVTPQCGGKGEDMHSGVGVQPSGETQIHYCNAPLHYSNATLHYCNAPLYYIINLTSFSIFNWRSPD